MILKDTDILNFKNIASATLRFSEGANCLLGMNGMGKSNLLDAIHFLCMTRTMASLPDSAITRHGEDIMIVKGNFLSESGAIDNIACGISKGKGKTLKRNGKEYARISEHIGRFPVVTATPADSGIITGASESRRKLMDMVISQARPEYLTQLIKYTRALESRNRMLRAGIRDALLFDSIESQMSETAAFIHATRKEWVEETAPTIEATYARLAGNAEKTTLSLNSRLNGTDMTTLLNETRQKDIVLGFTTAGPHRDDLDISLESYSLRRLGSQGQIKTFTVALRLAIFDYLKEASGITPILLLDDIFDKLDADRVGNIMEEVTSPGKFGQIFITDTNRKHLDDIMDGITAPKSLFSVSNGTFSPINS